MASTTRSTAAQRRGLLAGAILLALAATASAHQPPRNLGYGLDKLVDRAAGRGATADTARREGFAESAADTYARLAITDAASGRVLVDVTLSGRVPLADVKVALAAAAPSFTVTATDASYRRTGIIEGYVAVSEAEALATTSGVRAVFLALKPELDSIPTDTVGAAGSGPGPQVEPGQTLTKIGTAFDQGVVQHRVDRINQIYDPSAPVNYDGSGMTIAAMSDSYDMSGSTTAATDVANFDLPGAAGNPYNTQPVYVLNDLPATGTDEGRAMVQILHKMAPRAKLGFATGSTGEVAFAENIRQLANLPGHENGTGFAADVIVDDISYGGEPFYGESVIGGGIDDAFDAGVAYFSSAGNNIGINAYESELRWVPNGTGNTGATNSALVGTNIDLTGVPAAAYAGGFHNFNPQAGQLDVAQLVNLTSTARSTEMQWDDPYDIRDPVLNEPAIYTNTGTIGGGTTSVTFDAGSSPPLPTFTAGTPYVIKETATSGNFDGIVTVRDPSNNVLLTQDTGTDEVVTFYPTVSGQYSITITPYSTTTGDFDFKVYTAQGSVGVTSDLNLLMFRADTGAYISTTSLTTNNLLNNRPVELASVGAPSGQTQVQFVIARANVPSAPQLPTRVRWSVRGNGAAGIGPAEYFTYNAVTTKGHATARGCNGTAAYSVFRANLPESFTSPGPATILFDREANRLPEPEIREVPRVAAADAANTSFFSGDSTGDLDTNPNFSGTSAAAPHAAAVAALVLQSRGGPRSITPTELRWILQHNVFPHDLDPSFASGTATTTDGGTVTLAIRSDNDANTATGLNDPNSMSIGYAGTGSIASITLNPEGTPATAGHVTGGNNGIQDATPGVVSYFENDYPGLVFEPASTAFQLGNLVGLTAGDITPPSSTTPYTGFDNLAGAPSNGTTHFWTMTIGFAPGAFTDGKSMNFTVGRGAQHSAATGNGGTIGPGATTSNPIADLFGGGVFIPRGTVVRDGMTFSGTTTSGGTFSGMIRNAIGYGYSNVDGYGFIDAAAATDRIFADGLD